MKAISSKDKITKVALLRVEQMIIDGVQQQKIMTKMASGVFA